MPTPFCLSPTLFCPSASSPGARRVRSCRRIFAWFALLACIGALLSPLKAQLPVFGDTGIHDPSTLIKQNGRYYTFGTGDGIRILSSTNLRDWTAGRVFNAPPAWTTAAVPGFTGTFWAPDVAYFNGRYHVYYSVSNWGTIDSAIGLVTTPSLESPVWTDQGKVVQSDSVAEAGPDTDLTAYNCIDPSVLVDTDGRVWLIFGSYSNGILVAEINPATGKRLNTQVTRIANNGPSFFSNTTEGAYVYKYDGYYYLFLNFGSCCSDVDSTYNIRVGRSASITGPYRDRNGVDMNSGGGTMLFESTGRWMGPGHAGILFDNGRHLFSHHYYAGDQGGAAYLGLQELQWGADGWPSLTVDWSAFYPFDVDAREHMDRYDGALANGATVADEPGRGRVLALDGVSQHATLPLAVANARTFSAWVKWNGGGAWQRIFDFGVDTTRYLFLTPASGSGVMRLGIRNGGAEQGVSATAALPVGVWCHVAATIDGGNATLYLNGAPIASAGGVTIRPWEILARNNYLGRSQFAADPYFNGRLDAVRIFGRALSATEIADIAAAPPTLAHRYSFAGNARDSAGMAHGSLKGAASWQNGAVRLPGANGAYVDLPGGLVRGGSAVTIEAWTAFGDSAPWARLFDFGNIAGANGADFLFWSPRTSSGPARLAMAAGGGYFELNSSRSFNNLANHLALVVDPAAGYAASYVNGVLQNQFTGAVPALSSVGAGWSFLGRSLFAADPWLNATIDEFRIHDGRLTAQEIAASSAAGPGLLVNAPRTWTGSAGRSWDAAGFNWNDGSASVAWSDDSTALFGASGAGSITLSASLRARGLAFNSAGYVIASPGGASLTLGRVLPNVSAVADAAIEAPIVGAGGLGKTGAGRLTLRGAHSYAGDTVVEGGTLALRDGGAIYTSGYNSSATVSVINNATLELERWGWGLANGEKAGLGGLDYAPARLVLDGGRIRYVGGAAGNVDIFGPGFTIGANGATLESGKVNDVWLLRPDSRGIGVVSSPAGGALVVTGAGDGVFDKELPGAGSVTKTGTGTWTFTRANTYAGGTTVGAGALIVNGSLAAGGTLSVAAGATLGGSGVIGTATTIAGSHAPGDRIGVQTFGGALTYQSGSRLVWELAANSIAAGASDRVVANGAVVVATGARIDPVFGFPGSAVAFDDAFWTQPRVWTLLTAPGLTGAFTLGAPGADSAGRSPANYGVFTLQQTSVSASLVFTPYAPDEVWRRLNFGADWGDAAIAGDNADPDGDGLNNLLERAFAGNPLLADAHVAPRDDAGGALLSLVYRRAKSATDLGFGIEESADLSGAWTPAIGTAVILSDDGVAQTLRFTRPMGSDRRLFLRVRVTPGPAN